VRLNSTFIFCTTVLLAYSFGIIYVFGAALDEGTWEHVFGFTRIIIPDTFVYLTVRSGSRLVDLSKELVSSLDFQHNVFFVCTYLCEEVACSA